MLISAKASNFENVCKIIEIFLIDIFRKFCNTTIALRPKSTVEQQLFAWIAVISWVQHLNVCNAFAMICVMLSDFEMRINLQLQLMKCKNIKGIPTSLKAASCQNGSGSQKMGNRFIVFKKSSFHKICITMLNVIFKNEASFHVGQIGNYKTIHFIYILSLRLVYKLCILYMKKPIAFYMVW